MRGQRPTKSFSAEYPTPYLSVSPKGINNIAKNHTKIIDFCGKFVTLVLFASNVILVSAYGTTPLLTLSLKNVTANNTITQTCPKECVCKLADLNSITTDCTNANLTSVPHNISPNTTSL